MQHKVVILGGGVAGMSAAHELAERGFAVEVFEQNTVAGGKARSVEVPGTAQDGRPGYPGEHGFRFFPRFYKHVTDTMKRIPFAGNADGVYGNLVETSRIEMARFGLPPFTMSARFPQNLDDFLLMIHDAFDDVWASIRQTAYFLASASGRFSPVASAAARTNTKNSTGGNSSKPISVPKPISTFSAMA